MQRRAGVTVPIFSLRREGDFGIGEIPDLVPFAEWVKGAGISLVQVLPPHELPDGETSPYGAMSAFALDPIFASLHAIPEVDASILADPRLAAPFAASPSRVHYREVREQKNKVLGLAFERFSQRELAKGSDRARAFHAFRQRASEWLGDYCRFKACREEAGGISWTLWSEADLAKGAEQAKPLRVAYEQWILDEQWNAMRASLAAQGISLYGDLPFIVGGESADVWALPAQFQRRVSLGAPPDPFSPEGQDWGLPAYDFLAMEADQFAWLRRRVRRALDLYDGFRIDHVVGFFRQWQRVGGRGEFDPDGAAAQEARGRRVLSAICEEIRLWEQRTGRAREGARILAEDLGVIPPKVRETLRDLHVPGYRVIPWEAGAPAEFPAESVACLSTHDTAPIDGWWEQMDAPMRESFRLRTGGGPEEELGFLKVLFGSSSSLALCLVQELLGHKERINVPGTVGEHNWTYRLPAPLPALSQDGHLTQRFARIRALVEAAGRVTSGLS